MYLERYLSKIPRSSGWASDEQFFSGLCRQDTLSRTARSGIPLYSKDGVMYLDGGDECRHTLIVGSTGSGKTRRVLMPGVLSTISAAERSMVVFDVKGEISALTQAEAKARGYNTAVINFRDPSLSDCWNPFSIANYLHAHGQEDAACAQIDDIAALLCAEDARNNDPFWRNNAAALFKSLSDILWHLGRDVTIEGILNLRTKIPVDDSCELFRISQSMPKSSMGYCGMLPVIAAPRGTRGSILATLDSYMRPFTSRPDLTKMLSGKKGIDFGSLGEKRTVVYVITPDERATLGGLQCLMLSQMNQLLTSVAIENGGTLPVRTEFFVDELCNITPGIPGLATSLAVSRSRGMRYTLVIQNWAQLNSVYGADAETIASNCGNWIALYSARDEVMREKISRLCGESCLSEPLITASQFARLPIGQALVLRERCQPYITLLDDLSELSIPGLSLNTLTHRAA